MYRAELTEVVKEDEVRAKLEARVRQIGVSALARLAGVSTTNVYQALKGGSLGIAIPLALGYAPVRGFQRIGVDRTADAEPDPPLEPRRPKYGPKAAAWRDAPPPRDAVTSEQEMAEIWGRIDPAAAVPHVKPPAADVATTNGDVAAALAEPAMGNAKRPRPVPVPIPIDEPAPSGADVEDE